jgi:hypothetical protein
MGFKATFTGLPESISGPIELADYSVNEDATPLAAGDSTGSVGTFTLSIPRPDPYLLGEDRPTDILGTLGESVFLGSTVTLSDSRNGERGFDFGRRRGNRT